MNADTNNQHAEEHEQLATTTEQEQQQAAAAAAAARRKRLEIISVLQGFDEIPAQSKNKTDELVDHFLTELGDDNNNHTDEQLATTEQEQQATSAAARRANRRTLISVLQGFDEIPFRSRNTTNELVDHFLEVLRNEDEYTFRTRYKTDWRNVLAENFLGTLEDDVHEMLCETHNDHDSDNYRGLDSERDTEAEVEAIVRFFPEVLTTRKEDDYEDEEDDEDRGSYYPIQLLAFAGCNLKTVSFIPLLARLAIELGLFEENERGGLLCKYFGRSNVLHLLMHTDPAIVDQQDEQQLEVIDDKYLQVLIQLRKLGLLKKDDIHRYCLLRHLCREGYFAEKRSRFLVEWDPSALTKADVHRYLPLHKAAVCTSLSSTIRGFKHIFEAGIRYYPRKDGIGLLFRKNNIRYTPFYLACGNFGHEKVMEVVEDTIAHCYASSDNTPPLNNEEALLSAVIDENIHLDCVYFLLRRQPDILQKLLSSSSSSLSPSSIMTDSTKTIVTEISPKKRKRKDTKKNDHDGT